MTLSSNTIHDHEHRDAPRANSDLARTFWFSRVDLCSVLTNAAGHFGRRGYFRIGGHWLVVVVTVCYCWEAVRDSVMTINSSTLGVADIDILLLAFGLCAYFGGSVMFGGVWHFALIDQQLFIPLSESMRAYCGSAPAKYIPGKVAGVLLRHSLLCNSQIEFGSVVVACVIETLAVFGVAFALGGFVNASHFSRGIAWVAAGIAILLVVMIVASILLRWVSAVFPQRVTHTGIRKWAKTASLRSTTRTFALAVLGWLMIGTALNAIVASVAVPSHSYDFFESWLNIIGCAAMASVAGFLSGLPGGLGTREVVMLQLLSPIVGNEGAILAALVFRAIGLFSDFALAGVFLASRSTIAYCSQKLARSRRSVLDSRFPSHAIFNAPSAAAGEVADDGSGGKATIADCHLRSVTGLSNNCDPGDLSDAT